MAFPKGKRTPSTKYYRTPKKDSTLRANRRRAARQLPEERELASGIVAADEMNIDEARAPPQDVSASSCAIERKAITEPEVEMEEAPSPDLSTWTGTNTTTIPNGQFGGGSNHNQNQGYYNSNHLGDFDLNFSSAFDPNLQIQQPLSTNTFQDGTHNLPSMLDFTLQPNNSAGSRGIDGSSSTPHSQGFGAVYPIVPSQSSNNVDRYSTNELGQYSSAYQVYPLGGMQLAPDAVSSGMRYVPNPNFNMPQPAFSQWKAPSATATATATATANAHEGCYSMYMSSNPNDLMGRKYPATPWSENRNIDAASGFAPSDFDSRGSYRTSNVPVSYNERDSLVDLTEGHTFDFDGIAAELGDVQFPDDAA